MTRPATDIAASVRARLLRHATARGEDFELVLTRYAWRDPSKSLFRVSHGTRSGRLVGRGGR